MNCDNLPGKRQYTDYLGIFILYIALEHFKVYKTMRDFYLAGGLRCCRRP